MGVLNEAFVIEPERKVQVVDRVDVLVVGGGMSGCSAAVAAARAGARTLLIERYGFLGGTATAAMVGSICGLYTCGPYSTFQQLIYGHAQELMDRLNAMNAGFQRKHRFHFDIPSMQLVLDEWLTDNQVEILFHTIVVEALMNGNRLRGVIVENKGGRSAILAGVVVDASGDGDLAARAHVPFELGDEQGRLQAPTYVFYLGGVDIERAMAMPEPELKALQEKARLTGEFEFTRVSGSFSPGPKPGSVHVNMTRVPGVNGVDPASLSEGHLQGRKQIRQYMAFLARNVPGFENAYLDEVAAQLGIRETRRILGEYVLQRDDVLGAIKFPDAVCRSSWPIEDHTVGLDTVRLHLQQDDYYHVPYRCLVPRGVDNLLLAGRCISASHDAMASVRVMGPGIALGQAAGWAAAMAIGENRTPRTISVPALQEKLITQGALI